MELRRFLGLINFYRRFIKNATNIQAPLHALITGSKKKDKRSHRFPKPKKLSETQRKFSTYDRELYAIYSSVKFFRYMLEGRECIIATDHKPLTNAFN
ncbi:hypothetical protein ALC60_08323 [Trachymyrmex zeteki]|uniref:Reverse transcriptase RNase H-like domain-containing protein n=1 Tax=Mycetomoellerius zeteki TaxID=64791 RepID=A0A151WXZ7_9HYME|nr:hypothetical protein ALC60_08323 [Trachymyrmex zeteki]